MIIQRPSHVQNSLDYDHLFAPRPPNNFSPLVGGAHIDSDFTRLVTVLLAQGPDVGVGTVASVFGTGLLGGVLYWLLFHHLPAKDRHVEKVIADFHEMIRTLQANCKEEVNLERQEHQNHLVMVINGFKLSLENQSAQLGKLADRLELLANRSYEKMQQVMLDIRERPS